MSLAESVGIQRDREMIGTMSLREIERGERTCIDRGDGRPASERGSLLSAGRAINIAFGPRFWCSVMRLVVNIVLVALTAAGPWVCCCTTAALSRAASQWSSAVAHKRQPARTCCHQTPPRKPTDHRSAHKHHPAGAATKPPGSHDPAPHDRTCPCRDQRQEPVAITASDDSRATPGSRDISSPTGFFLHSAIALRSPSGRSCAAAPPGALSPFMSTDDRLYAHHALRC